MAKTLEPKAQSAKAFSDFEGQTALLDRLARDFQAGQFAHAYLFLGPDGVGKFSVACLCAMAAVCRHGGAAKAARKAEMEDSLFAGMDLFGESAPIDEKTAPCGECGPCVRVLSRTHPDVKIIEIGKSMGVDAMRELIADVQVRAFEGGAKVVVLRGADRMTVQAQNCLLKTLEEPPAGMCFILTAKTQSALLPTILSRCRLLRFHPLSEEAAARRLSALGVEAQRVNLLAHQSEGRVGAALEMAQDETYFALLSRIDQTLFSLRRASDIPSASAAFKDEKDNAERILLIAEQLFRDAMRLQLMGESALDLGYSRDFAMYVQKADAAASVRMLRTLQDARKMRASNVPFLSIWEKILLTIAEEHQKWQW